MTTVEKRRSSRKSGSHRKHNDGSYSDTETDREVSSLTDRAFRSLCIGDEAVYNDSDLSASPCKQRERQLAISHNVQEREDRDRQELKRTAHESFSLRLQQYGQEWTYQGSYGPEIHKDQQWGVYGERGSQGRLSATFQHSFVEAPQQEHPLRELSLYSNGATEVSSQQGRSRSRVSSLIRAFNSDGQRDEAVYNNETSWDKSALMSIERELSEFSAYQQNMNAGYFPSAGLFSSQNTNYYSSEVAAISQMNSASSFMRSSHSKHIMSTQGNCNSNFFIHSEFSPFKVWRDYNRFPFHRGQVSGFMPSSEFSKWYETPMYKELSLQPQQPSSMFQDQGMAYHRNTFAPTVPMNPQRSTSTSTMMQRASAVEKRCESELAGHYRKRAQSLGANRLPSQRPSTASPSSEMSRRVQDTISSVKSLQQKIKMMAEQNIETQSQGVFYNNDYLTPYSSSAMVPSIANNNTAPYNMMQRSSVYALPDQQQVLEHHPVSPQPIEHAPVRAESRGATPDIKMSSYKSRAASLLYNLKDNRKRVKSTYSPSKYKGLETQEKYKQEPKDFIIDVPEFSESELLHPTVERGNRLEVGQYGNQNQGYGPEILQNSQHVQNSQRHYLGQDSSEYYRVQMQGEAAHHHGFTGFPPEYYINNQLANGQNPYENLSSFTPYKHSVSDKGERNYVNRQNTATEMQRFSAVGQSRDYVSKGNSKQLFNEAVSGEFTGTDKYNQLKENKYDYDNVYSQDKWGQTNSQEIQKPGIPSVQNYQNINAYQRTNAQENVLNYNCEPKPNLIEHYGLRPHGIVNVSNQVPQYVPLHTDNSENPVYNTQHQPGTYRDIYAPPVSQEYNKGNKMKENYAPHDNHKYYDQESKKQTIISSQEQISIATEESGQRQEPVTKENRMKSLQPKETKHFENTMPKNKLDVQEQVMSTTNQAKDGQVPLQQNKTAVDKAELNEINLVEERSKVKPQQHKVEQKQGTFENNKGVNVNAAQDKDVPTPEEQIKLLRVKESKADPHEIQEVTDTLGHMMEAELQRPEPKEQQQLIAEHVNAEELKEEPIKCELAQSSEQARIEQVKSEPSCKYKVKTEQAKEQQVGAEHVGRECTEKEQHIERCEADQAVKEHIMENQASAKPDKNNTKVVTAINNNKEPIIGVQNEMEKAKMAEITKEDKTKINATQRSQSEPSPKQQVKNEPDKVEQAKTELAKAKAELAKIKEKMKGEQKVQKEEENIDQVNSNVNESLKEQEPVVTIPTIDQNDRGADDYERIREKYGSIHATINRNKTATTDNVKVVADKDDKTNTAPNSKKTSTSPKSELTLGTKESKEKTKSALYDDPTGSQYVYSESSKDFKLSGASNIPDNVDKSTNDKNDANKLKDVSVEKEEKSDASQQRDATKQLLVERKLKSTDQSTSASKETLLKGLTPKERAQTKQEILTSKIKAHAEKEISAIKEGFAIRDGFKMSTKPLTMSQNMSIRQKPPSQEAYKKQESAVNGVTPKVLSPPPLAMVTVTATSQPADSLQKQMKNIETATEKAVNKGSNQSHSIKSTEKHPVTSQVQGHGDSSAEKEIRDKKGVQPKSQEKSSKQDNLDKGTNAVHENTAPSLQLVFGQNENAIHDDSLKIMGIMVTVRERNRDEKDIQEELSAKCNNTDKQDLSLTGDQTTVDRLSEEVNKVQARTVQDDNQTKQSHIRSQADSMAITRNRKKSLTEGTTEKIPKQESTLLNNKPQSETQLPDYVAEKVVPSMDTVPAKNKVLAETQPPPKNPNIIAEDPKDYTNKTSRITQETSAIKGQEEISGILIRYDLQPAKDVNKAFSLAATPSNDEKTQVEDLHIDSIAIRVVPAVTAQVKIAEQRTDSNDPVNEKEATENKIHSSNSHQESANSNDDVQKVLSSVRKQAQLLKNCSQQNINNTTSENTGNYNCKTVSETGDEAKKELIEEGYFQVEKRDSEPQNISTNVETPAALSNKQDLMRSLSNSDTVANKSPKDEKSDGNAMGKNKAKTPDSSESSIQDGNMRTSKQASKTQNDLGNKNEKSGAGHSHHTRRHHTTKERQRGFQTMQENSEAVKAEVRPKPKVPIPEISAIADYARLKVIVSQDNEDPVQELPPNKKEGFFPLIQSRHSRRPVFTADSQEVNVKEKSSQNKSDTSGKLSKDPKPVVFPITEKEHRRTGMFKLGDKEKTDAKENIDTGVQDTQENRLCLMEQTKAAAQDKITDNEEKNAEEKIKHMLEKSRATQAEEEKRAAQREEEQRAREREAIAMQIREKRKKQREAEGHTEKERKTKVVEQQILKAKNEEETEQKQEPRSDGKEVKKDALQPQGASGVIHEKQQKPSITEQSVHSNSDEHQSRATQDDQQRKTAVEEQYRKAYKEEQQKKVIQEEEQQKVAIDGQQWKSELMEEQQRMVAQTDEQKKRLLLEEQRKTALTEEQKQKVAQEEQRKTALNEEQRRVALEEEQRKTAQIEQQRKALVTEEQRKRAILEEQQRKAALEEQRKMAQEVQQRQAEEQKRKAILEDQQRKAAQIEEQQRSLFLEEQERRAALEEQRMKAAQEEQQRKATFKEEERRAALEEQQRKMAEENQQRKAALIEEQKRKAALEEQQRKAALEEQKQRAAQEEQQKKAALKEEQRRAALEEHQRKRAEEEQQRKALLIEEQKKKAALEEQQRKAALEEQKQRAAVEEQQKKAALKEEKRRAALEEQQRKMAEEEQQRKAALIEEQKRRAALEEQQRKAALEEQKQRAAQEEQQKKAALKEEQRRAALEEQQRKKAEEEQQRKALLIEEQKKRAALEEQQRKASLEEQKQRAAVEEQQKKAALKEEKRRTALKEQQRKMAEEEQQRKAALIEEQKRRAALEEQQRKAALEEQKRRAAQEEQQKKAALKEEQRRATLEEQQRKLAEEEQQRKALLLEEEKRRAALEEQQRKAALEEEKQRAAVEEQQKKAALKEEKRRTALKEQQRKMAEEEQQRKVALIEEQKRREALEEQQRKAALEEQKQRAAQEEQQKKAALQEEQRRAALEEHQKKRAEDEQQRKALLIEEQKKKAALEKQHRKAAQDEQLRNSALIEEQKRRASLEEEEQQKRAALKEQKQKAATEEQRRKDALEKQRRARQEEEERRLAYIKEERIRRQIEEEQEAEIEEERRKQQIQQQRMEQNSEEVTQTKDKWKMFEKVNQVQEQSQTHIEKDTGVIREQDLPQREMNIRVRQSVRQERATEIQEHKNVSEKTEDLQYYSLTSAEAEKPSPPQKRNTNTNEREKAEDSVFNRPHAPASPAPSLPRSSASSPALGTKPSMFKVKDNTIRGSSLTKSIKPRFHKNFGEEFRVCSPMDQVLEKTAEEQDILRCNAGTPIYPDPGGLNKLLKEPRTHGYSTPVPQHRPYSRRSLVLDEEDCRSIISNMSEDVESFATSAADLADIRTLYDSERPESACSYSSDVSRSFGKPPAVPPKSEKALRRAKRLATRRLKKEVTKTVPDDSCEDSLTEESNTHAVASPHFASPVSLAHAPPAGSSVSLSHSEHLSQQRSFHASTHATAPISLPIASPHNTVPVSNPSSRASSLSTSAVSKTIPHVPSSPTLHHAPKPVTQYQVESGFPQSYPVTQRRVLQDIGSGQYYVVDVPVEVKTKTFFDPETGKYVQLNVRESGRNPQRQPLQAYPQPQLKSQLQANPQQQPNPSGNALYQGYPKYPKSYQSAASSSGPLYQSPATVTQDQQPIRASINHQYGGPETGYSPEKTPYMDTVNNADKAHNVVYSTRGSQEAPSEGDSQLANSRFGSRDIITMSELEDFMEVSDW